MGWQDCAGLGAGAANRTFACDTNAGGGHTLVGSFVAPTGLTLVQGFSAIIDLQTPGATLSPWWAISSSISGCRAPSAASHSTDFRAGPFSCLDYFEGNATGSGVLIPSPGTASEPIGPNRARIKQGWTFPDSYTNAHEIKEGTEVYAWKVTFNNSKTVGLGSCSGCSSGACIVFNGLSIYQFISVPSRDRLRKLTNPALRAYVTWQGGGGISCPDATPAQNAPWGKIKTLYR